MGGKSKGGSVLVGYKYFWDIHSGLGRGPVDEIVELRIDNKTAYVGTPGELSHSKAVFIDKPNLFGGADTGGEGGVQGRLEILMGEADQKPSKSLVNLLKGIANPPLLSQKSVIARKNLSKEKEKEADTYYAAGELQPAELGSDDTIPGFRGIVTTLFSGMISAYNAYPKKHSYRVRRTIKGWHGNAVWYAEKCRIVLRNDTLKISGLTEEQERNVREIHSMNPAHILVECATNKSWGGKKAFDELDLDSFKKAADTLYEEGLGLCIRYNRDGSLKEFMQLIVDHIGAVLYDDTFTGKQAIRLLRKDYEPDDLHTFNYDNGILYVQDDDSSSASTAANQIIVKYIDPLTNESGQAIANNIASVQMHGVISKSVEYKGIPTFDLAARLAQRDLEATAGTLSRLKIVFDMRAGEIRPGDVFKVHLPDRGIENAVFRAGVIENGDEGEVIIVCIQDVFNLPETNYSTTQTASAQAKPDFSAYPAPNARLMEIPYIVYPLMFGAADLAYIKPTDCILLPLATKPTSVSIGFDALIDSGSNQVTTYSGEFVPSLILSEDVSAYQREFKFDKDGDYAGIQSAAALLIDDEIVRIDAIDWQKSTISVGRGCADTVPQPHKAGARIWGFLMGITGHEETYVVGENVKVKVLPKTQYEILSEDKAGELNITMRQRQARPYPPANVKVNGTHSTTIAAAFSLSWAHRDRDLQQDKLISHDEDGTMLGEGVSYEIVLMQGSRVVRSILTTAESFTYPDSDAVRGEDFDKVTLYAKKGDLLSLQGYTFYK